MISKRDVNERLVTQYFVRIVLGRSDAVDAVDFFWLPDGVRVGFVGGILTWRRQPTVDGSPVGLARGFDVRRVAGEILDENAEEIKDAIADGRQPPAQVSMSDAIKSALAFAKAEFDAWLSPVSEGISLEPGMMYTRDQLFSMGYVITHLEDGPKVKPVGKKWPVYAVVMADGGRFRVVGKDAKTKFEAWMINGLDAAELKAKRDAVKRDADVMVDADSATADRLRRRARLGVTAIEPADYVEYEDEPGA